MEIARPPKRLPPEGVIFKGVKARKSTRKCGYPLLKKLCQWESLSIDLFSKKICEGAAKLAAGSEEEAFCCREADAEDDGYLVVIFLLVAA